MVALAINHNSNYAFSYIYRFSREAIEQKHKSCHFFWFVFVVLDKNMTEDIIYSVDKCFGNKSDSVS